MFWTFILLAGLAIVFIKLGMLVVWVAVLSGGLQLAAVIIVGLVLASLWRKAKAKKEH